MASFTNKLVQLIVSNSSSSGVKGVFMKSTSNNNNNQDSSTTFSNANYESKYHETEVPTTLLYSDYIDSFVINNQHDNAVELPDTTLTAATDSTAFAASFIDTHTTSSTTSHMNMIKKNQITSDYIIHKLLVNKQAIKQLKVNLNKEKEHIKEAFHSYDKYFTSHKERILKKMMMMIISGDADDVDGISSSSLLPKNKDNNDDHDDEEEDSFAMFSRPLNKSSLSRNINNSPSNNKKKDKVKIEFESSDKMKVTLLLLLLVAMRS